MTLGIMNTGSADFASATASTSTGSYLIPRKLLGQVILSVRKNLVLRGLVAKMFGPSDIPGRTLVIPFQTDGSFIDVDVVDEGAEFPLTQSKFENATWTPVKYGARIAITREMEEDSIISLGDFYAEQAGYEFANNEESLIVAQLDAASTASSHDVANSNATLPVSDITEAMQNLEADNYVPSHMIVGVEVANDLRNIDLFNEANKTGGPSAVNQRLIGSIFGMKVIVSNSVSAKLAYVIDSRNAVAGAEKRPLSIERYMEPQFDTGYIVASQRIAYRYWRAKAVSEITTT